MVMANKSFFMNLSMGLLLKTARGLNNCPDKSSAYLIRCVKSPSRSLGSNQVLFGGIICPLSAMSNS